MAPVDARTCPSDFTPVTGGQATSRYKFYGFAPNSTIVDFPQATTTCTNAGGYVAIPNDASELAAFETISQNPSQPGYWVGISDAAVEGSWRTVLGDVATYLPWKPAPNAQPNGGTAANCVVGYANVRCLVCASGGLEPYRDDAKRS